ncbi:hypothetical protein D3C80_1967260 [compost metagenome]
MAKRKLNQQVVVIRVEEVRCVTGSGFEVDVVVSEPSIPVHMLRYLRAPKRAEIQQRTVANAMNGFQLWMLF